MTLKEKILAFFGLIYLGPIKNADINESENRQESV